MTVPVFRELTREECEALLGVNHVGRLAFSFKGSTDIEPIHYVFDDGWIFGRTSEGSKIETIGHQPYVAFEVDEVRGTFDWRSVVAHGTVYLLAPDGGPTNVAEYERALGLMRRFSPEVFTPSDPVPFRTVIFGIHVDSLTGREASLGKGRRAARPKRTT